MKVRVMVLILLGLLISVTLSVSCSSKQKTEENKTTDGSDSKQNAQAKDKKPLVVCTTTFITDMARNVAGDDADVIGIMKPGTDPHTYAPRPDDGIRMRRADLILANGLHLESNILNMIRQSGRKRILLAEDDRIQVRDAKKAAGDPHVWWRIDYFIRFVEQTRDALVKLVPEAAERIRNRSENYLSELKELHRQTLFAFQSIPEEQRMLITSHDAFYYFGQAYGLKVDAVLGISTESQAKAAEPMRLAEMTAKSNIRAIFHETSVSMAQNNLVDSIKNLAKMKFNHELAIAGPLFSDSLGEPGVAEGSYIGAFKANVRMIVEALSNAKAPAFFQEKSGGNGSGKTIEKTEKGK